MEALAILGVTGNTVQFLDFASRLCAASIEIYRAADGASASNAQAEELLKSFIESIDDVSSNLGQYCVTLGASSVQVGGKWEAQVSSIISDCHSIADDLFRRFDKLKSSGKSGRWKSFVSGVKCMWQKQELEELQERLKHNRSKLEWRILLSLRESLNLLASRQEDQFRELQSAVVSKLTEAIREQISTLPRWPESIEMAQKQLRTDSIAIVTSRYKQPGKSALRRADPLANKNPGSDPDSFADEYAAEYAMKLAEMEEQQWRSLWFPVMDDREEQIADAELKTFDWILGPPQGKQRTWDSFIDWLEYGGAIYWINGKAGSGKSTLMKYLKNHRVVKEMLEYWANGTPLITVSFFFWYNGNTQQKTQEGLLRSLLYQALENHRELIPIVLSEAAEVPILELASYWTLPRLKCAFKKLVEQKHVPLKICLLVDGLDEYAGDHFEIAEVFRYAAHFQHIKVCVSSRPLLAFDRAFKDFQGLMLQNLTFDDIQTYIQNKFNDDDRFKELEVEEPGLGQNLAFQVVSKASGVFLWVKLVVHSLLEGIQNFDRGVDLERRLNELPEDLTDLYWHILDRVKPVWYLEEGFKLLLLVYNAVVPLSLLQLTFARMERSATGDDVVEDMSVERQNALCRSMAGRIKSRCLGLLEVTDLNCKDEKYRRVQFLHKSVKDFIDTPKMMCRIQECLSKKDPIIPEISIMQGLLLELRTVKSRLRPDQLSKSGRLSREAWFDEVWCIALETVRYAAIAKSKNPKSLVEYERLLTKLDELTTEVWNLVGFRGREEIQGLIHWSQAPRKPGATILAKDGHAVPDDQDGGLEEIQNLIHWFHAPRKPWATILSKDGEAVLDVQGDDIRISFTESDDDEQDDDIRIDVRIPSTQADDDDNYAISLIHTDDDNSDSARYENGSLIRRVSIEPNSKRVRFAGLPFPGEEDDDERPSRSWPDKTIRESVPRGAFSPKLATNLGFEEFVRKFGLNEYADERFGTPEDTGANGRTLGKGEVVPRKESRVKKMKQSLWSKLSRLWRKW